MSNRKSDIKLMHRVADLACRSLSDLHDEQSVHELETLFESNPLAIDLYQEVIWTHIGLNSIEGIFSVQEAELAEFDQELWEKLLHEERTAPEVVASKAEIEREIIQKVIRPERKYEINKSSLIGGILATAAILFIALFLRFVPENTPKVDVAAIVDQMDAKWAQVDRIPKTGDRLWTNEMPLNLQSGMVKIQYDDGVDVLVEGPAVFEISKTGMYMEYGRLYSRVSNVGLGFVVQTPTAQFVDLGTEFGVQADVNGSAELHVMKGKVQLFAGLKDGAKNSLLVSENKAVRYNANSAQLNEIPVEKQSFVRSIDSQTKTVWRGQTYVSLADIIGGGNGFGTGKTVQGIDLQTGQSRNGNMFTTQRQGQEGYVPVRSNSYIDGVFVFGGQDGSCQVTSQQHVFQSFKPTSLKYGNSVMIGTTHTSLLDNKEIKEFELRLNGVPCGTAENPSIFMHANAGITLDLDQIRSSIPNINISKFTSEFGIADGSADYEADKIVQADCYVLIDGQPRFTRLDIRPGQIAEISVDISGDDRFLTLIAGEGEKGTIVGDWALFTKPMLVIAGE